MTEELSKEEWCARFVKHMCVTCPHGRFEDGESIANYAEHTAPTYFETDWQREEGPEACADADMSYWGEEL